MYCTGDHRLSLDHNTTNRMDVHIFCISDENSEFVNINLIFIFRFHLNYLTIRLQPPFFSIVAKHFGHSFVYFVKYSMFKSLEFFFQFSISAHGIGSWEASPHWKQKLCPHVQVQFFWWANSWLTLIANAQPGAGHHRNERLCYSVKI